MKQNTVKLNENQFKNLVLSTFTKNLKDNKKQNQNVALTQDEKIKALIIKENAYLIYRGILYSKDIDSEIILNSLNKIINELKNNSIIPIGKWVKGIGENGVTTSLFCSNCNYENKHWENSQ